MPSTLAHQTGFLVGIVLPLAAGMKVVYQDLWEPEVFCRLADDETEPHHGPRYVSRLLELVGGVIGAEAEFLLRVDRDEVGLCDLAHCG